MALDNVALGKRVKHIRKKKGHTQMELAELLDKSTTYISDMERGIKGMSLETLVVLANVLHVSADEILVDSLENTIRVSNHEFARILSDCTDYEKRVLLDIVTAAKQSLRKNLYCRR